MTRREVAKVTYIPERLEDQRERDLCARCVILDLGNFLRDQYGAIPLAGDHPSPGIELIITRRGFSRKMPRKRSAGVTRLGSAFKSIARIG